MKIPYIVIILLSVMLNEKVLSETSKNLRSDSGGKDYMKNSDSIFNTFDPEMVKKFKPETWYDKVSGPTISFHRFFVLKDFDPDWILVFKEIEKYNMAFVISEANYCFEHKKIKNIHHHA